MVADSVVVGAVNNGELRDSMFSRSLGDARLRDSGRRAIVTAYERRMASVFTHPVHKYKVTWRRAIEVQARMLLGVLDGTRDGYQGVVTR